MAKVPARSKLELRCIIAAAGKPPHFSSKLKSAALCREANVTSCRTLISVQLAILFVKQDRLHNTLSIANKISWKNTWHHESRWSIYHSWFPRQDGSLVPLCWNMRSSSQRSNTHKQRESKAGHYENQTNSSATLYLRLCDFPGMGCLIPSNSLSWRVLLI